MYKDKEYLGEKQVRSEQLESQLYEFLASLLHSLNQRIDRRLVSTFMGLVISILLHRHCNHGLLLSELGGYLLGAEHCRAGTKRLSNLLHSEKWKAGLLSSFLWKRSTRRVEEIRATA